MRLSDFAREGIERSGSYRFADHLYRNEASGRGALGRWLDRRALNMPAAQAMRRRYLRAKDELQTAACRCSDATRVLAVPCGIPRDVIELAKSHPELAARIDYTGMDLDIEVVRAAEDGLRNTCLHARRFVQADALDAAIFPTGPFDLVISTGLGEFLDDNSLRTFYGNVFASLHRGGTFYTSATAQERRSDYLLRAFELDTHYRSLDELSTILAGQPWSRVVLDRDESGLQTFVRAIK